MQDRPPTRSPTPRSSRRRTRPGPWRRARSTAASAGTSSCTPRRCGWASPGWPWRPPSSGRCWRRARERRRWCSGPPTRRILDRGGRPRARRRGVDRVLLRRWRPDARIRGVAGRGRAGRRAPRLHHRSTRLAHIAGAAPQRPSPERLAAFRVAAIRRESFAAPSLTCINTSGGERGDDVQIWRGYTTAFRRAASRNHSALSLGVRCKLSKST